MERTWGNSLDRKLVSKRFDRELVGQGIGGGS
jgi:hypothetical protein